MRGPRLRTLLVLLVLAAFTLTLLDSGRGSGGPLDALRRGSDAVFGPAQRAVGGALGAAGDALGGLGGDDEERLQRENDALRRRVLELEGTQAAGEQLRQLLQLKDQGDYTVVPARVVGYGAFQPFGSTVTLDAGSDDGVREDMTVTSGSGLVGKVVRVAARTSTVSLLTDPVFSVGVRVNGQAGSFGIASGSGRGELALQLVDLPGGGQLSVGDALVTAGSDTFAAGVPVGRVSEVGAAVSGAGRTATLTPFVELGALDVVGVVVDGPRTAPRAAVPPGPS